MLYRADDLWGEVGGVFAGDLQALCTPAVDAFAEHLNQRLRCDEEFQDRHGLYWDGTPGQVLSRDCCAQMLRELDQTLRVPKSEIRYEHTDRLNEGAMRDFAMECGGGASSVGDARAAQHKLAALRGQDLAGFVTYNPWRDVLSVNGLFAARAYRGRGLGATLLYEVVLHAHREGRVGIDVDNLSLKGEIAFRKMAQAYAERAPPFSVHRVVDEDFRVYGELRFRG